MNEKANITEELKSLLEQYDFNITTLSNYLQLSAEGIKRLSNGEVAFLPDEPSYRFRLFKMWILSFIKSCINTFFQIFMNGRE